MSACGCNGFRLGPPQKLGDWRCVCGHHGDLHAPDVGGKCGVGSSLQYSEATPAATTPEVVFRTREYRESDTAFVFGSFLDSMRESNESAGMGNDVFYGLFKEQLRLIVAQTWHWTVRIAHPEGEEDEIAGWVAYHAESRVVAYVYVKKTWRRWGVATLLLDEAGMKRRGQRFRALFGAYWARRLAHQKGYNVEPVSYVAGVRLVGGV